MTRFIYHCEQIDNLIPSSHRFALENIVEQENDPYFETQIVGPLLQRSPMKTFITFSSWRKSNIAKDNPAQKSCYVNRLRWRL